MGLITAGQEPTPASMVVVTTHVSSWEGSPAILYDEGNTDTFIVDEFKSFEIDPNFIHQTLTLDAP